MTLIIWINHSMRLSLTRSESIELTTIITPRQRSPLWHLFLVRLGDYIVNSCDFYSYRIIRSSAFVTFQWVLPLLPRGLLLPAKSRVGLAPSNLPYTRTSRHIMFRIHIKSCYNIVLILLWREGHTCQINKIKYKPQYSHCRWNFSTDVSPGFSWWGNEGPSRA
jgi:hypothetical protein